MSQSDKASADRVRQILNTEFGGHQSKMAQALGISQPVISRVITGNRPPGKHLVEALARYPRLNPQWVLMGEGEPYLGQRAAEVLGGWPVPIANCLLAGAPDDHRHLLSTRVELVPRAFARPTIYAVEALNCGVLPKDASCTAIESNDLLLIDTDLSRLRVESLLDRLVVIRGASAELALERWCKKAGPSLPKIVQKPNERERVITLDPLSSASESKSTVGASAVALMKKDFPENVVGYAVRLIRDL